MPRRHERTVHCCSWGSTNQHGPALGCACPIENDDTLLVAFCLSCRSAWRAYEPATTLGVTRTEKESCVLGCKMMLFSTSNVRRKLLHRFALVNKLKKVLINFPYISTTRVCLCLCLHVFMLRTLLSELARRPLIVPCVFLLASSSLPAVQPASTTSGDTGRSLLSRSLFQLPPPISALHKDNLQRQLQWQGPNAKRDGRSNTRRVGRQRTAGVKSQKGESGLVESLASIFQYRPLYVRLCKKLKI